MQPRILRTAAALLAACTLILAACSSSSKSSNSASSSKDTSAASANHSPVTLNVGGFGAVAQLPGAADGVKARVKEFNDKKEIEGVTLAFKEYADDKQDPATALSEVRRLVTEQNVQVMLGATSLFVPGAYLKQQQVPVFGWGFDDTYCSAKPSTDVWSFGWNGCVNPSKPSTVADLGGPVYKYVSGLTGKQRPTIALFSGDNAGGAAATSIQKVAFEGAGFEVVFAKGIFPNPVADYTPYVQQLLTSAHGSAPDAMLCLTGIDCIATYTQIKASGYKGAYGSTLYSDLLLKPFAGSFVQWTTANFAEPNPYKDRIIAAVQAVNPDRKLDSATVAGYLSTDMFIQALKTVAAKGNDKINGAAIQKAASDQKWEAPGFAGPTVYPAQTVGSNGCTTILADDGTAWTTKVPYTCSPKTFPVG